MLNFLGESAGKKSERMKNIEKFRECKAPGIGSSRIFHVIDFCELGRIHESFSSQGNKTVSVSHVFSFLY